MYTRICLITVVIIGLTGARADDLALYDSLRREAESYAVYCTTHCQQEMEAFLKNTNQMSTCSFTVNVEKGIANTYDNLLATNVVFCIERQKDSAKLYKVVLHYENGYQFEASYVDGSVFNLVRQTGEQKFRTYHMMIEENDPGRIMCVDTEVVTQGRRFDFKYGPIRYYRNRKLEREDPPAKLSSLLGK